MRNSSSAVLAETEVNREARDVASQARRGGGEQADALAARLGPASIAELASGLVDLLSELRDCEQAVREINAEITQAGVVGEGVEHVPPIEVRALPQSSVEQVGPAQHSDLDPVAPVRGRSEHRALGGGAAPLAVHRDSTAAGGSTNVHIEPSEGRAVMTARCHRLQAAVGVTCDADRKGAVSTLRFVERSGFRRELTSVPGLTTRMTPCGKSLVCYNLRRSRVHLGNVGPRD